jgi:hypothetical protein
MKNSKQMELPISELFAEDFPARTSPLLEKGLALKESVQGYGQSSPVLLAKYDQDTQSWKTSRLYVGGDSEEFSETWPRSGMTRNGTAYRLPPLVRLMRGIESGLLPTPTASCGIHLKFSQSSVKKAYKKRIGLSFSMSITELSTLYFGQKINPTFVEEMMGYPEGWSDLNS